MAKIHQIHAFLKNLLDPCSMNDVALNGIQVETDEEVTKAAFAVDASLEAIERARDEKCNLLVVHHGFFWGQMLPICGNLRKRIFCLLNNGIGLIAYHLPLDVHPEYGNNVQLLKAITSAPFEPFGKYKNITLGFMASISEPLQLEDIVYRLGLTIHQSPYHLLRFGPSKIRTIAAVSGSGALAINEAIEKKVELLITGDASHQIYHTAKEAKINVLFAGHYFTETFGIRALMEPLRKEFGIQTVFFDIPTGL